MPARTASAPAAAPSCPPGVRSLGMVAVTTRGRLELLDLATCRLTTLPGAGARQPHFSPNGRWLAYTQLVHRRPTRPVVTPARGGGPTRAPLGGGIVSWTWGPRGSTLYGLTVHGSLLAASPTGRRRTIATGLSGGGGGFVVSPDGRSIVVNHSHCGQPAHTRGELERVDVRTGRRSVIVTQADQPFALAGSSPDGRWLVFWEPSATCSASINTDGMPLAAVRAGGGRPVRVIGHMLEYADFLTWCGDRLIVAGGPRVWRETNQYSGLIASSPPAWHSQTIQPAHALSWVSPACAPSGRVLAAAAGPSSGQARFGLEHRSIWLLRPDGRRIRRLAPPPARGLSDEAPRFSADGRWIMFVRTRVVTVGRSAISRDRIMLQRAGGGPPLPILGFTSGDFSYYDHFEWPDEIAWDSSVPRALPRRRQRHSYRVSSFTPAGPLTAWALTTGNQLHDPPQAVVRTGDGGARWSNVTPPDLGRAGPRSTINDLDVLDPRRAWLAYGQARQRLLRTVDGGRGWTRAGVAPANCQLQFVDARDGWCVASNGAAGSMFTTIYRTRDGGRRWQHVARSTPPDRRGGPTQIPFACDKSVRFVSPTTGFVVPVACAGGEGYVYRSTDGGRTWRQTLSLPEPRGGSNGSQFTQVVGDGQQEAVGVGVVGYRRTPTSTTIFTSHDGGLRWLRVRPPAAGRVYAVALVSPRVWRLAAGREIEATDDGGGTWVRIRADANLPRIGGVTFATPSVGWDVDLATDSRVVLHTTDDGAQWHAVRVPQR